MTHREFLEEFISLEEHLFSLVPALDKKQGFLNLLKYLQLGEHADQNAVSNLYVLWQNKNKASIPDPRLGELNKRLLVAKLDFKMKL